MTDAEFGECQSAGHHAHDAIEGADRLMTVGDFESHS